MKILLDNGWEKTRVNQTVVYEKNGFYFIRTNGIAKGSRCDKDNPHLLTGPLSYVVLNTNGKIFVYCESKKNAITALTLRGLL